MSIERKKIPPSGLQHIPMLVDKSKLKMVKVPPKPKIAKVNPMFLLKKRAISWVIGLISTIPEEYVWQFLNNILTKLQKRFDSRPGLNKVIEVFKAVLDSVATSSDGGRTITKAEFKKIVETIW